MFKNFSHVLSESLVPQTLPRRERYLPPVPANTPSRKRKSMARLPTALNWAFSRTRSWGLGWSTERPVFLSPGRQTVCRSSSRRARSIRMPRWWPSTFMKRISCGMPHPKIECPPPPYQSSLLTWVWIFFNPRWYFVTTLCQIRTELETSCCLESMEVKIVVHFLFFVFLYH